MNNKKVKTSVIVVFICFITIIFSLFYFLTSNNNSDSAKPSEVKQIAQEQNNINNVAINNTAPKAIIEPISKPVKKERATEVVASNDFTGISKLSDKAKEVLETAGVMPVDVNDEDVVFLEFDLDTLRKLEVGNTFDFEIPQTQEIFTAEITQVDNFDNGDKSLISNVIGQGGEFHTSIITVGNDAMYGQFTTISGNWVFESKNEYGWVAAKRDLYKNHIEFEPSDVGSETTSDGYTITAEEH